MDAVLAGVIGLLLGSFLNVVIHRLPQMLERQWAAECASLGEAEGAERLCPRAARVQPAGPRSRCPGCGHQIRWYENIPVLSYLALRGKCSACQRPISVRYPWSNRHRSAFRLCRLALGHHLPGGGLVRLRRFAADPGSDRLGYHAAAGRHHPAHWSGAA
jgi:leader peptidase (prepilin peptidase)/N-methyltransferase